MVFPKPKFVESPYFVGDFENWHLLPGAPKEIQEEFNEFMKLIEDDDKNDLLMSKLIPLESD